MSENTTISWTDHTFNPWRGCTKISPACTHCYAAREAIRFPNIRGIWGDAGTRILAVPSAWKQPLKWDRKAFNSFDPSRHPRPRVFCASLADVFEDWQGELRFPADIAPEGWLTARWDGQQLVREFGDSAERQGLPVATMDNARTELFRLIEATPNLDWQLLTKRSENILRMVPEHWRRKFPDNVWIGTTVEGPGQLHRILDLEKVNARIRFISCEPLLGDLRLREIWDKEGNRFDALTGSWGVDGRGQTPPSDRRIHWVIAGGESGPKARPSHPAWFRSLRDQCAATGTPFHFKQWGEWAPVDIGNVDHSPRDLFLQPDGTDATNWTIDRFTADTAHLGRFGRARTGHLLDGVAHLEFPEPRPN